MKPNNSAAPLRGLFWRSLLSFLLFLPAMDARAYQLSCRAVWQDTLLPEATPAIIETLANSSSAYLSMMSANHMTKSSKSLDLLKTRLATANPEEKQFFLNLIKENYNLTKALKYDPENNSKIFKRHLDAALSELSEPDKTIARVYKKTLSIEHALDQHFAEIQKMTDSPVRMQGKDVINVAKDIQKLFFAKRANANQGPVVLYGSFVNGRAFPQKSDLDFAVFNSRMNTIAEKIDLVQGLPSFEFLEALPHLLNPRQADELGYLNRIVIHVSADTIEVRVYRSHLYADFQRKKAKYDSYKIDP